MRSQHLLNFFKVNMLAALKKFLCYYTVTVAPLENVLAPLMPRWSKNSGYATAGMGFTCIHSSMWQASECYTCARKYTYMYSLFLVFCPSLQLHIFRLQRLIAYYHLLGGFYRRLILHLLWLGSMFCYWFVSKLSGDLRLNCDSGLSRNESLQNFGWS